MSSLGVGGAACARSVAAWALVRARSGENSPSPVPRVIPLAAAQPIASSAQCPTSTSLKMSDPRGFASSVDMPKPSGSSSPRESSESRGSSEAGLSLRRARSSSVTLPALVRVRSGENSLLPVPRVIPLAAAQPIASSAQCPTSTSVKVSERRTRCAPWRRACRGSTPHRRASRPGSEKSSRPRSPRRSRWRLPSRSRPQPSAPPRRQETSPTPGSAPTGRPAPYAPPPTASPKPANPRQHRPLHPAARCRG